MADEKDKKPRKEIADGAGQKLNNTSDREPRNNRPVNDNQDDELRKLGAQLNRDDKGDKRGVVGGVIKRVLIILLILILLGGIGVAIYFFTKTPTTITQAGIINISTQVTENLTDESDPNASITTAVIYPGDKYSVRCMVRNSESIDGDDNLNEYSNIFVRYSIMLEVDGVSYNHILVPVITNLAKESWHVYNPDEEDDNYVWDGYYYYYGSLSKNQSLTLFEEIEFDFHDTLNSFGNKTAKVTINIEAVHADVDNLGVEAGNAWSTAPRRWINNMQKGINNNNGIVNI